MPGMQRPVVGNVVQQHAEDAIVLHGNRSYLVNAPHVKLLQLRRCDDRLAAHLDAMAIAGNGAWEISRAALENPSAGAGFVVAVGMIRGRQDFLEQLCALAQAESPVRRGMMSGFGWVDAAELRGWIATLLASVDADRKAIGIACSAMHRVDPGLAPARLLDHTDPRVRARAFRTAAELGKREFVSRLAASIEDEDPACGLWAAWSAVLLGDREQALDRLMAAIAESGPHRWRALQLALQASDPERGHALLQTLAGDSDKLRMLIEGAGYVGDARYLPWLIGRMSDDKLARLAGAAFSMTTGLDLAALDLERKPPEDFESGPGDDAADPDVEMDPDDGLPWPDPGRVQAWWSANGARFVSGTRYFMGAPVTQDHCADVLKNGYQRQRIAAAYHLCLSNPGTPLFEWRAPAWRQQQELARLG